MRTILWFDVRSSLIKCQQNAVGWHSTKVTKYAREYNPRQKRKVEIKIIKPTRENVLTVWNIVRTFLLQFCESQNYTKYLKLFVGSRFCNCTNKKWKVLLRNRNVPSFILLNFTSSHVYFTLKIRYFTLCFVLWFALYTYLCVF